MTNPELMHAFKSDLTLASDVFRSMLDGPFIEGDQEVVRIKDTDPWNFKNLLVAIHTYADETRLDHLELSDYVELGLLADKFLVQQVVNMCFEAIKSNVSSHTVWDTLNRLVLCPQLSKACDKYLSCNTKKCLDRKSTFNCVSEEAFVHFLKLEKLCVTEDFLIDECIELDKARKWENPSEPNKWIKLALPHLRILSLPANTRLNFDLSRLRKFLTPKEQRVLAQRMLFGGKSRLDPAKLCSITKPRDRCAYHFKRFTNYMKNN